MGRPPDYEYTQGRDILNESKGKDWDLVRYYVSAQDREIDRLNIVINNMKQVFKGIKQFTDQ